MLSLALLVHRRVAVATPQSSLGAARAAAASVRDVGAMTRMADAVERLDPHRKSLLYNRIEAR